MNEILTENWNEIVSPTDSVIHLGDVALGKIDQSLPLVGELNGRKYLVPGNHDRIFSGESKVKINRFFPEYNKYFEILPECLDINIGQIPVILSHFPYAGDSQDTDRHADKRPIDNGLPLIHGHVHEKWKTNGRMFNVGVDVNDYRPVSIDEIRDWLKNL